MFTIIHHHHHYQHHPELYSLAMSLEDSRNHSFTIRIIVIRQRLLYKLEYLCTGIIVSSILFCIRCKYHKGHDIQFCLHPHPSKLGKEMNASVHRNRNKMKANIRVKYAASLNSNLNSVRPINLPTISHCVNLQLEFYATSLIFLCS